MTQSTQQQLNFFDDSNGQVGDIPSQFCNGEDSNPLQLINPQNKAEPVNTRHQTIKREHTAPKVLLSVLHKVLYWQSNTTKLFHELLSEVNKNQNNSTALKLRQLAIKAQLIINLQNKFVSQAEKRLRDLKIKKKWSQIRFNLATEWKVRIARVLKQASPKKAFDVIWQGHNHKGRYQTSVEDVKSFKKKISKLKLNQLKRNS